VQFEVQDYLVFVLLLISFHYFHPLFENFVVVIELIVAQDYEYVLLHY
jgi:hypothetical protein